MDNKYPPQSKAPPSHPPYAMAPPASLPASESSYRRDPPGQGPAPYHPPPAEQQHGPAYAFAANAPPGLASRTPLPDQLASENGAPASLPPPPGQVVGEPPPLDAHSMIELGRRYTLDVVQQPKRARMCGFGDKDRRPITPPPCIRLIITDAATGAEIGTNDIDYGLFVLNVDLWSQDGLREVNLVRHSAQSPAIASSLPAFGQVGYTPVAIAPLGGHVRDPYGTYHANAPPANPSPASHAPYPSSQPHYAPPGSYQSLPPAHPHGHYPPPYPPPGAAYPPRPPSPGGYHQPRYADQPNQHPYYHPGPSGHGMNPPRPGEPYPPADPSMGRMSVSGAPIPAATGMFTRNLIGSLSASAFRLTDPSDKSGIWFVLQDLSVRTEGHFRLRFSFVNVGLPSTTPTSNGNAANPTAVINTGKAPILASCYSDVFTVYSAKKFPGVVESTPLSKCFATQGIKIPIRKDGPSKTNRGGEYDDDDD